MSITIKDVAKLAGVSPATVSLVINGKSGIKQETRDKVSHAIEKIGYTPNISARNLVKQKSNIISLIVTDIKNPFYSTLVYEMQQALTSKGFSILLGISNNSIEEEARLVNLMISQGVGGILLVPCRRYEDETFGLDHLYEAKRSGIPIIFVTDKYMDYPDNCVMSDLKTATYELVDYLLNMGKKKIVFLCDGYGPYYSRWRIEGYTKAYDDHQLQYRQEWIMNAGTADTRTGMLFTKQKILPMHPDAIVCINATSALGVMAVLKEENISVPEDMAVACFDELEYNDVLYLPLTYSRQDLKEICIQAIERLKEVIGGDTSIQNILIPGRLCIRSSTE